jgi:F-type H+-transporting ATPase subunit delta
LHGVLDSEDITGPVRNLLDVLVRRGRITVLPEIAETFEDLVDERLKRASARVRTATELSSEQQERLSKALSAFTNYDIRLKAKVDPRLLGGVVVRIGSTVLDGSVRTRLNRLRETLLAEEGRVG